jgi:eukaryotic-like serine/threonine-protein kinase
MYVDPVIPSGEQRLIADRYLLGARLGSGGMGTVWQATDRLLERQVAVKELRLGNDPGDDAVGEEPARRLRRVLREARTIARISHPHVVDIYDLIEHEERLWIVMELVDGPSLDHHLATAGPLSPCRTAEVGLQLLGALEAVHAAGALHRDVKPANVLLRRDGTAVLTDFGIAALADGESLTRTGALVGSLEFIAPERLLDRPAGPPSDLFSLGATLCVLATGRPPFARPEIASLLHAVAYEEPDIPDHAEPLRSVIAGLLRKDPAQRLTAADAAHALRAVSALQPATHRTAVMGAGPPPRRRRWLRWAVPAAAVLVAGGFCAGYLMSRPVTDSRTVTVSSRKAWRQVDIPIHQGDRVSVHYLSGTWTVDRRLPSSGPEGFNSQEDAQVTAVAASCKLNPDVPFATLLDRFSYEQPTVSHSLQQHQSTTTATAAGRLLLRINDGNGCLSDNAGSVRVRVEVTRHG